ncbi:hypothetical protein C3F09_06755 [candidate division GN15 bacterium]|uniref:DUF4935 domain-containing protein n=1 Tax=candidate division GN15 bacterium TaxID=2072418 RepID=A0A855X1I4_9BACT|nr:MAG: hypothetical protein C3F09_06755 [candidate division GN15 bacterium]
MRHKERPLLFVDTNILLDFYRAASEKQLSLLRRLHEVTDSLITTDQVLMEFCKNRQKVIGDYIGTLRVPDSIPLPGVLSELRTMRTLNADLKRARQKLGSLENRLLKMIEAPSNHDPVFQEVLRLFGTSTNLSLSRSNPARNRIRRLARKRFTLGYPPRKDSDTSMGDAINWEWMIHCATSNKRGLVIVSRDTDYGCIRKGETVINDWLRIEFRERVSKRRRITLTSSLSSALKQMSVQTTSKERQAESQLVAPPLTLPSAAFLQKLAIGFPTLQPTGTESSASPNPLRQYMESANSRVWEEFIAWAEAHKKK